MTLLVWKTRQAMAYSHARGMRPAIATAAAPGTEISAAALVGVADAAPESELPPVEVAFAAVPVAVAKGRSVVAAAAL